MNYTIGVVNRAGTVYTSGAPEFTPAFVGFLFSQS